MTERGERLRAAAEQQIAELISLVSAIDDAVLHEQCAGREKLGDGTIAANAQHAADNYTRIATFVAATARISDARSARLDGATDPRALQAAGSRSGRHDQGGPAAGQPPLYSAGNFNRTAVIEQLSATSVAFKRIAELSDRELDTVPANGSFRFCNGQRTLEGVLTGLLNHQRHQLEALKGG